MHSVRSCFVACLLVGRVQGIRPSDVSEYDDFRIGADHYTRPAVGPWDENGIQGKAIFREIWCDDLGKSIRTPVWVDKGEQLERLGSGGFGSAYKVNTGCDALHVVMKISDMSRGSNESDILQNYENFVTEAKLHMLMAAEGWALPVFSLVPEPLNPINDTWKYWNEGVVPPSQPISAETRWDKSITGLAMALASGTGVAKSGYRGKVSPYLMFDLTIQLIEGLLVLHKHGYLHRDCKPDNFFWEGPASYEHYSECRPGECRFTIADFGLACRQDAESSPCTELAGTLEYMSPSFYDRHINQKMAYDQIYDHGTDFWSLGITLLQVWIGYFPEQINGRDGSRSQVKPLIDSILQIKSKFWFKFDTNWLARSRKLTESQRSGVRYNMFVEILTILLDPDAVDGHAGRLEELQKTIPKKYFVKNTFQRTRSCVDPCKECPEPAACQLYDLQLTCK